jgi:hypothetical protein
MSQETEAIGIGDQRWVWWAGASTAQVAAGVAWCRRGYSGTGASMPLKAFAAASLFVSSAASAATASFFASGFQSVISDHFGDAFPNVPSVVLGVELLIDC